MYVAKVGHTIQTV